jgi:hypothetical protein
LPFNGSSNGAWFIADIDTLKKFYGQGFRENSIPRNPK